MTDLPNIGELVQHHSQEAAKVAYGLEEKIVTDIRTLRTNWVRLAQDLYEWNESKAWAALDYSSLEEWLASPDIELSRSQYFRLVENYREFVITRGVTPELLGTVDFTKVREVLPAIRRGHVDPAEAIADAQALTRSDLEEKYRHRDPIAPLDRSINPDGFHYETCETCGQKVKVRDDA